MIINRVLEVADGRFVHFISYGEDSEDSWKVIKRIFIIDTNVPYSEDSNYVVYCDHPAIDTENDGDTSWSWCIQCEKIIEGE